MGGRVICAFIDATGGRCLDDRPTAPTFRSRFNQIVALAAGDEAQNIAEDFGLFDDDDLQPKPLFNPTAVAEAVEVLAAACSQELEPTAGPISDFEQIQNIVAVMIRDGQLAADTNAHDFYRKGRQRAAEILREHRGKFEAVFLALLRWRALDAKHLAEILGPPPAATV
jgi:hypothetical protein